MYTVLMFIILKVKNHLCSVLFLWHAYLEFAR